MIKSMSVNDLLKARKIINIPPLYRELHNQIALNLSRNFSQKYGWYIDMNVTKMEILSWKEWEEKLDQGAYCAVFKCSKPPFERSILVLSQDFVFIYLNQLLGGGQFGDQGKRKEVSALEKDLLDRNIDDYLEIINEQYQRFQLHFTFEFSGANLHLLSPIGADVRLIITSCQMTSGSDRCNLFFAFPEALSRYFI
jgi:flagellar motor switch protein FliM